MKYALVILEANNLATGTQALRKFADSVVSTKIQNQGIELLNVGAYIVALNNGLNGLSHLLAQAEEYKLSFRTLFFENDPLWIITSFKKE